MGGEADKGGENGRRARTGGRGAGGWKSVGKTRTKCLKFRKKAREQPVHCSPVSRLVHLPSSRFFCFMSLCQHTS